MKDNNFHRHLVPLALAALMLPLVLPVLALEEIPRTIPEPPSIHKTVRGIALRGDDGGQYYAGRGGGDTILFYHEEENGYTA